MNSMPENNSGYVLLLNFVVSPSNRLNVLLFCTYLPTLMSTVTLKLFCSNF